MICESCGKDVPEGFRFCPHCGSESAPLEVDADLYKTIPPDIIVAPEREETDDSEREVRAIPVSGPSDETIPPRASPKKSPPVLTPPKGPRPESFFRNGHTKNS